MSSVDVTDRQRRLRALVFQIIGLGDVVLGAALAVLGPRLVGGDAELDLILQILGAVLALTGFGIWWWGRFRQGAPGSMERSGLVMRRPR